MNNIRHFAINKYEVETEWLGVTYKTPTGALTAVWHGGAYIDLTFIPVWAEKEPPPSEVINMWDDETNQPRIPFTLEGLRAAVLAWMEDMDKEWPEWFEGYVENTQW